MTPERWQQVKEIFNSALQYQPAERPRFVLNACNGDQNLRDEVESLIASHEKEGRFIDSPAYAVAAGLLARDEDRLEAGQQLGSYEIVLLLGKGGMGHVYLAHDRRLGRKVALKFLQASFIKDGDRARRFEQEARAASALNQPNILTIHEIGDVDGRRFIAAEYIDGETLRERMLSSSIALAEVLTIAEQIASALTAAHAAGIIHRDIKPENVMLRRDGIVKVLDFGLAKLSEARETSPEDVTRALIKTSAGLVMGTVAYMSPEQARGLPLDTRTDIWSLGVILFEMVTGHVPFEGKDIHRQIIAIQDQEPPPLTKYAEVVPKKLEEIAKKTLAKDVAQRYQTPKDLLIDLINLRRKLEVETEIERTGSPELRNTTTTKRYFVDESTSSASLDSATPNSELEAADNAFTIGYIQRMLNRHNAFFAIVTAVLLVLAAVTVSYLYFSRRNQTTIDSIAVLPFVNGSNDPNTEYLSDGVTESVINSLSELPQLRVMARSTVFHFKGRETNPQVIGKELGVRAVMTGRLLQQGDTLLISVELVNVSDGTQFWGEQYNRRMVDLATVPQDISREITSRLRLKLSGEEQGKLNKGGTNNTEAYQLFLRGRYYFGKGTADDFKKAIEQFRQAIDRDPNYALAYVDLAECYRELGAYAGAPASETLPNARVALERALQIDGSLAEAHEALAALYASSLQWDQSEREYLRAISLNPNVGHIKYANFLRAQMRYDEALREIKRAQTIEPLSPEAGVTAAFIYRKLGDLEASISESKRVIALDPTYPVAHLTLGFAYLSRGHDEEAIAELEKAVDLSGRASYAVSTLGGAYATSGRRAEALRLLQELKEKYARGEANGTDLAITYAGLGDDDQAIDWLERDLAAGNTVFLTIITNTLVHDRLHNNPRYKDFLRRMGLNVQQNG